MGTEVAIRANQAIDKYDQREFIDAIKQTVCKGATDAQLKMFIEVCRSTGLNPWLKEIWYVAEKGIIMAGRDGYLRVANEHPQFDGIETRVERDNNNVPIKAVCTVWRKDRAHPTICEAYYNEYQKGSPVWKQYPSAMIGKVAEVLALKRSFAINGVVSEEEVGAEAPALKEAPKAVAERKIAEMKSGKTYVEVSTPEPPIEDAKVSSTLDQILATFKSKAEIASAFEQMREYFCQVLDATAFQMICGEFAVDVDGKDFGTVGNAKKCFTKLWNAYKEQLAVIDAIPVEDPQ